MKVRQRERATLQRESSIKQGGKESMQIANDLVHMFEVQMITSNQQVFLCLLSS